MKNIAACAVSLTLAVTLTACESTTPSRGTDAQAQINEFFGGTNGFQAGPSNSTGSAKPAPGGEANAGGHALRLDWDDPCAGNLDEIDGALLDYYRVHKVFPPTLEQIPQVSPSGVRISLTCPVSGKRYVYHPEGLRPPPFVDDQGVVQLGIYLILYDAEPSHYATEHRADGTDVKRAVRIGIVWDPRRETLDFVPLEQNILDVYLRNAQQPAPAPIRRPAGPIQ